MNKQQGGFTLIELIMVIVILGILAAFALPRFADLSGDARQASLQGAQGAVRSASAIVHSTALARAVTNGTVTLEGQTINVVNSYTSGTVADISAAAQLSANDYTIAAAGGVVTVTLGTCSFTYTQAGAGGSAVISTITDTDGATPGC
ncbi:type II secretion system protein [Atopomonas sediminilitoris]|uniref:type II secretion system protein n=1 Tax=Atopomonas sediminilitoris TaxID=2919919 RepID=UPI002343008E|nr:type II secretion system protein [Atopomonas sediminilitoris]